MIAPSGASASVPANARPETQRTHVGEPLPEQQGADPGRERQENGDARDEAVGELDVAVIAGRVDLDARVAARPVLAPEPGARQPHRGAARDDQKEPEHVCKRDPAKHPRRDRHPAEARQRRLHLRRRVAAPGRGRAEGTAASEGRRSGDVSSQWDVGPPTLRPRLQGPHPSGETNVRLPKTTAARRLSGGTLRRLGAVEVTEPVHATKLCAHDRRHGRARQHKPTLCHQCCEELPCHRIHPPPAFRT